MLKVSALAVPPFNRSQPFLGKDRHTPPPLRGTPSNLEGTLRLMFSELHYVCGLFPSQFRWDGPGGEIIPAVGSRLGQRNGFEVGGNVDVSVEVLRGFGGVAFATGVEGLVFGVVENEVARV